MPQMTHLLIIKREIIPHIIIRVSKMPKLVLLFILAFLLTQIGARRRKVDLA